MNARSPREVATELAAQISAALSEKCISWGAAINAAEKAKGTAHYELKAKLARAYGLEVANLSAAIAAKLRPEA